MKAKIKKDFSFLMLFIVYHHTFHFKGNKSALGLNCYGNLLYNEKNIIGRLFWYFEIYFLGSLMWNSQEERKVLVLACIFLSKYVRIIVVV